jgi:RNA 2',3'-cyclic 3'-phosphodiesterase
MRIFVAIVPPIEIREILGQVRNAAADLEARRIRWTATENLHITVKFLGEVSDPQIPAVCSAISSTDLGRPFELRPVGVIGLPERGPHRILAAAMEGDIAAAKALAESIDSACHAIGFPLESRPFRPHVTLARAGREPFRLTAEEVVAARKLLQDSSFIVEELVLMESTLLPTGPKYGSAARFSLSKIG